MPIARIRRSPYRSTSAPPPRADTSRMKGERRDDRRGGEVAHAEAAGQQRDGRRDDAEADGDAEPDGRQHAHLAARGTREGERHARIVPFAPRWAVEPDHSESRGGRTGTSPVER